MEFTILHTNDIHSRFEAFAKASTKISELRDENTLVLDAGDFNDFMRIELQGTRGRAGAELLDAAGYDAIAIGNNEGFEGIEAAETLAKAGKVSFLSCNVYKYSEGRKEIVPMEGVKRSIVRIKGGIRFLVIGASPFGTFNQFFDLLDMRAEDAHEEIKKEIKMKKGEYDICILLSHCGINRDREMAENIEGIDIIVGGHSHTLMEDIEVVNNTIIHQSGNYGEYLGVIRFEVENSKVVKAESDNIKLDQISSDERILSLIESNKVIAIKNLSKPLYKIGRDLWHDVVEENPMTNFLADALREVIECDFSIINSGVLSGGIRKGNVSRKKLLEICPSPLNPTYFEIQGKYILEALKQTLKADVCMGEGKGSGFRGRYLGRLHLSGAAVEHDGENIVKVVINGSYLDEERWYRVASSDYLQRGTGYESLSNNRNLKYNVEYIRDTLREYLAKNHLVDKAFEDRWIRVE